jgi:hypothetical protein
MRHQTFELGWWLLFGVLFSSAPWAVAQQFPLTPPAEPTRSLPPPPSYPHTATPMADPLPAVPVPPVVSPSLPSATQPTAPVAPPTMARILQGVPQPFAGQARQPTRFAGSRSDSKPQAAMPPRPTFTGRSRGTSPPRTMQKPFSQIGYAPTISPYLQLDRGNNMNEPTPNYFTFVRPRLQQHETNRRQEAELRRLGHQVRQATTMETQGSTEQSKPATGHRTYFLNTGQFYSGFFKQ